MKQALISILFAFSILSAHSQVISVNNHVAVTKPTGLDKIFIFPAIDANTEISYTGSATNVVWYKFVNGARTEISNVPYIYPENNTGYICNYDGTEFSFWVFDYSQYAPQFNALTAEDGDFPCENTTLKVDGMIPEFVYQNPMGGTLKLTRDFTIKYKTLEWKENAWTEVEKTETVTLPTPEITVTAPYTDTSFEFSGDNFASDLGLTLKTIQSSVYTAKAVKCNLTTATTVRDALNENSRPNLESVLEGSAPLDIQFFSNPTPNVKSYLWKIFKDGNTVLTRSVKDHIYTFSESGNYKITLKVSNQFCSDSAEVKVNISESEISAPKIFTPNGDGLNDEFRVAYTSITEFQGTILNRWGRVLFKWTDPAKGWDGTINGAPASEGTYFYIITATGSDKRKYKLNGHINLLR